MAILNQIEAFNLKKVKEHFNPAPSEIVFRLRFHKRSQRPNESIPEYVAALMHLSENCNFGKTLDDMLRDRLVGGVRDEEIAIASETAQRNTEEIRTSNNDPAFISTVEILSLSTEPDQVTKNDTIKEVVDPKSGDDTTSVVETMKLASILRIFIDVSKMKSYQRVEECISYCARKKIRDKGLAERLTAVKNNLVNDVKILLFESLNEKLEDHLNTTTVTINNAVLHCEQKVTALETTVLGQTKNITDFQQNLLACMDLTEYLLKTQKAARRRDSLPTCSERIASLARKNDIVCHFARHDPDLEAAILAQDEEKIHEILDRLEKIVRT
ncbi:Leucine-rich repeat receptor-like protein [Trichinella spiralis]|uniref:Leucine-rich repeat receptor-like protein n=1 Tax=Trichinella spiralis TaxID=6334 RepID=A0ABR3K6E8_TRISP